MRIATGEREDNVNDDGNDLAAKALDAKGGRTLAENMTLARRAEIARPGAIKRRGGNYLCNFLCADFTRF
jgi:hypothetical protein